jgi:hypothetical protein
MEHSIFLDSEKINSIRESLERRFNQIKIIDDSVTPKIIQWLNDFFSFLDDLKQGVYIFNKNIELERWFDYLNESKPYLYEYRDNIKELLTEEEYENYLLFVSYHKIKEDLYEKNSVLETEIINDFYFLKLPILKPISSSIIRGIAVRLKKLNKYKKQFEDLKKHIEEFYFDSISDNTSKNETQNPVIKLDNWHPFHNDDVRDFYIYLESKYNMNDSKNIFSAFWEFFIQEGLIDLNEKKRIKQSYFSWINEKYNFKDDEKIDKLQTNLEGFDMADFEKHYDEFERSKGDDFRFDDFRDGTIKRTKKKRATR